MENNGKDSLKIYHKGEKIEWGVTSVEFYVKEENFMFGNLKVPPKSEAPIDEGHPNGEYAYCQKGNFKMTLLHKDKEAQSFEIKKGDSFLIPAKVDHQIKNLNSEEVSLIFVLNL